MTNEPTILDVIRDFFPEFLGPTWRTWRLFLATLFALPMDGQDIDMYRACTGRLAAPVVPAREA